MEKKSQRFIEGKKEGVKNLEIWFQDETRFGQKGISNKLWTIRGLREQRPRQDGFKSAYLIGAVNPNTGQKYSLIFDGLDSRVMNEFLNGFSEAILPHHHVILFLDRASWHSAEDLKIPSNMTLYFLPPYSPELNPIERLWNYLKSNFLSRKILANMEDVFDIGAKAWNQLSPEIIKSVCRTTLKLNKSIC
jgi:transposase